MADGSLQSRYFDLLLEKVEEVHYPSHEIMNRVEQTLSDREQIANYVSVLLDKVEETSYPSLQMLDRIENLVRYTG
jgi:hypothetical protein